MNCPPETLLRPNEFACLPDRQTRLYAEIIQVVEKGQRYWARPVLLFEAEDLDADNPETLPAIYDLRACADLLWPRSLFRSVLDTELIPLLARLNADPLISPPHPAKPAPDSLEIAHQKMRQFAYRLWHTYPEAFQD
ncbi:MAG: hypothetical protein WCD18_16585 [Thermosynechococcaceae cyanobacterium]